MNGPLERLNPGWAAKHWSPQYTTNVTNLTVYLNRILLPAQLCFFLGGLMMGILQVKDVFMGQALGPIIYNLGMRRRWPLLLRAARTSHRRSVLGRAGCAKPQ